MIEFKVPCRGPIKLGHTGENEAVHVAFSLLPFKEAFPGGAPALLVRRKGDAEAYPVTLTVEGDTAYWTVTSADTEKAGFGQCELQWYLGDMLAKSDKFDFLVAQALEAGAEPPDEPSKRWFEALEEKIGDLSELTTKAKENLVAAINEAARSGGASGGAGSIEMQVSGGYIQYSTDGGETWENLIAIADLKGKDGEDGQPGTPGKDGADGAPGQDGYSPAAKVEATADGAKITITDKTGTTEVEVKNGKDGAKGDKGDKGDTGATPDIQIGTVTTLPAGSDATASMSGTAENPLLNLGIPKGASGGGGETWELLADQAALEENAVFVSFDVPDCKKYIVLVSLINASESAGNRAGAVVMNNRNIYQAITGGNSFISQSNTTRSAIFRFERMDGRMYWTVFSSNNGDGVIDGISDNMFTPNSGAFTAPDTVTSLRVTSLNQAIDRFIGVGSRIKIYGVRT